MIAKTVYGVLGLQGGKEMCYEDEGTNLRNKPQ